MKKIIFISGVYGVGKSTLCTKLKNEYNINHYSASKLISIYNNEDYSINKNVKDVEDNQNILVNAINYLFSNEETYLLDGHFCILNKDDKVECISIDIFKKIMPLAIILVYDNPNMINSRLNNRDNKIYDIKFIEMFQNKEMNHANKIAEELSVPILNVKTTDYIRIRNFIKSLDIE